MIKDITLGQYYKADSPVHRLDPRTKIILTIWFIVAIFLSKNFISLGIMIVFLFVIIFVSKVPVKMFFKNIKPLLPIILFTVIINLIYMKQGDVLLEFWKIKITTEGVSTAIYMCVRIITLIMASSILTYTTVPTKLTDAIESLLSPLKVFHLDIHSFAMMMTLALRFIPTLVDEIERIMNAQKARGADLDSGNLIKKIKALVPVLIPLFVSSFSHAYDLAFAMSCRCYRGGEGRTRMKKMKFGVGDLVSVLVFSVFTALIVLSNIYLKKFSL